MRICLGHPARRRRADPVGGRTHRDLPRRTWGYLPEERGLYPRMTVLEQLVFFAGLQGVSSGLALREARYWLDPLPHPRVRESPGRGALEGQPAEGPVPRRGPARPEVLLMDEPFTGLDPVNIVLLREAILELRDRGKTILLRPTRWRRSRRCASRSRSSTTAGRSSRGHARRGEALDGRRMVLLSTRATSIARLARRLAGARLCGRGSSGRRSRSSRTSSPRRCSRGCPGCRRPRHPLRGRRALARAGLHRARRPPGRR